MDINKTLAKEFSLRQEQVDNTVALIDDDKTIPFIARYRKELTGSLDDQILRELYDRLMYLRNLEKRKEEITSAITEQEKMTPEIEAAINAATTLVEVEDIYRPFKPKRRTRASIARENGLEPLAALIMEQNSSADPEKEAEAFVSDEKNVPDVKTALQGAMDIIAEDISDDADIRKKLRTLAGEKGELVSKASDAEAESVILIIMSTASLSRRLQITVYSPLTVVKKRASSRSLLPLTKSVQQVLSSINTSKTIMPAESLSVPQQRTATRDLFSRQSNVKSAPK